MNPDITFHRGRWGVFFGDTTGSFTQREPVCGEVPEDSEGERPVPLRQSTLIPIALGNENVFLSTVDTIRANWRFGEDFSPQLAQIFDISASDDSGPWFRGVGLRDNTLWDIDHDGDLDIVSFFAQYTQQFGPAAFRVGVYLREGDSFDFKPLLTPTQIASNITVDGNTRAKLVPLGLADVDEDGLLDIVWSMSGRSDEGCIGWSRGLPGLHFGEPVAFAPPWSAGLSQNPFT
ncbi:MAG: hypothetical protein N3C12_02260 [Candidatus Binatia bacterium]|nr:hypothetical protein [Candidatus Binatia bacterium]